MVSRRGNARLLAGEEKESRSSSAAQRGGEQQAHDLPKGPPRRLVPSGRAIASRAGRRKRSERERERKGEGEGEERGETGGPPHPASRLPAERGGLARSRTASSHLVGARGLDGDGAHGAKAADLGQLRRGGSLLEPRRQPDLLHLRPGARALLRTPGLKPLCGAAEGGEIETVVDMNGEVNSPSLSPDGRSFASSGIRIRTAAVAQPGRRVRAFRRQDGELDRGVRLRDRKRPGRGSASAPGGSPRRSSGPGRAAALLSTTEKGARTWSSSMSPRRGSSRSRRRSRRHRLHGDLRRIPLCGHDCRCDRLADLYLFETGSKKLTRLTRLNEELFSELAISPPEEIWYESFDGKKFHGWIVKPPASIRQEIPLHPSDPRRPTPRMGTHSPTSFSGWPRRVTSCSTPTRGLDLVRSGLRQRHSVPVSGDDYRVSCSASMRSSSGATSTRSAWG